MVAAILVVCGFIVWQASAPSATSLGCDAGSEPDDGDDAPRLSGVAVAPDGSVVALSEAGVSRSDNGTRWSDISDRVPADGAPNSLGVAHWGLVAVGETYQGAAVTPYVILLPAE